MGFCREFPGNSIDSLGSGYLQPISDLLIVIARVFFLVHQAEYSPKLLKHQVRWKVCEALILLNASRMRERRKYPYMR